MPTKSRKMSPERAGEVRERFARAVDDLGELDSGALAAGEPMPSEGARKQARRMIGGLESEGATARLNRLASLLDELSELDRNTQADGSHEAA